MLVLMALHDVMVVAPITCIGGVMMALREDPELSLLLIVAVPLLALLIGVLFVIGRAPQFRSMQAKIDRSTGCCASRSPASG